MSQRVLIATSLAGTKNLTNGEEDCGFSGIVPPDEVWTVVYWRSSGNTETDVGVGGQTVTVTKCHKAYYYLGICNGKSFFWMRKYRIVQNIENIAYDCINNKCVPQIQNQTEGMYPSLAECEANCSSGHGCNGECVSKNKLSQLEKLVNRLKRKNCGH